MGYPDVFDAEAVQTAPCDMPIATGTLPTYEASMQERLNQFYMLHRVQRRIDVPKLVSRVSARSKVIGEAAAEAELNNRLMEVYGWDLAGRCGTFSEECLRMEEHTMGPSKEH